MMKPCIAGLRQSVTIRAKNSTMKSIMTLGGMSKPHFSSRSPPVHWQTRYSRRIHCVSVVLLAVVSNGSAAEAHRSLCSSLPTHLQDKLLPHHLHPPPAPSPAYIMSMTTADLDKPLAGATIPTYNISPRGPAHTSTCIIYRPELLPRMATLLFIVTWACGQNFWGASRYKQAVG